MKKSDFKQFKALVNDDPNLVEHAMYYFLNLTDKQVIEIIDTYKSMNMVELTTDSWGRKSIKFGTLLQFGYPLEEYNNNSKTPFTI